MSSSRISIHYSGFLTMGLLESLRSENKWPCLKPIWYDKPWHPWHPKLRMRWSCFLTSKKLSNNFAQRRATLSWASSSCIAASCESASIDMVALRKRSAPLKRVELLKDLLSCEFSAIKAEIFCGYMVLSLLSKQKKVSTKIPPNSGFFRRDSGFFRRDSG